MSDALREDSEAALILAQRLDQPVPTLNPVGRAVREARKCVLLVTEAEQQLIVRALRWHASTWATDVDPATKQEYFKG